MADQAETQGGPDDKDFRAGENVYAHMLAGPGAGERPADPDAAPSPEGGPKSLERGDVEALLHKATELQGMSEVQQGLELTIIGGGLQVMADRYGADKLLGALQAKDPAATTIGEVAATLAPDKAERTALFAAIEAEPMEALGDRLNQTLGGVAPGGDEGTDSLERFRRFEMTNIKDGKATDASNQLLTGNFDDLLEAHPELAENFRQTGDTLLLLKDMRTVYETEYAQFSSDLEHTKSEIEQLVSTGEAGVAELQTLSHDIYSDEVSRLEARKSSTSNPDAQAMIQTLLDQRTAEAAAASADLARKSEAVRAGVVAGLGAERVSNLSVPEPVRPEPTHRPYNS